MTDEYFEDEVEPEEMTEEDRIAAVAETVKRENEAAPKIEEAPQ